MEPLRAGYRAELAALEDDLLHAGSQTADLLDAAVAGLADARDAAAVRAGQDVLTDRLERVRERGLLVLARQAPVATELRLVHAILTASQHVDRMGGLALKVAVTVGQVNPAEADEEIVTQLWEMARRARRTAERALEAFARRDTAAGRELHLLDEPLDRLQDGVFALLLARGGDRLEWALRMTIVARCLERFGDHAVEVAEQVDLITPSRESGPPPPAG